MIRRKIWATATCLAVAGAAQAQTGPRAAPGPVFVPRNYVAPLAPGYSPQPAPQVHAAPQAPVSTGAVAAPAELFAVGTEDLPQAPATPVAPMAQPIAQPMGQPMGQPMTGPAPMMMDPGMGAGAMPMAAGPMMGDLSGGAMLANPMAPGPMLNGGPITEAPYLDGGCTSGPCAWVTGEYLYWRMPGIQVPVLVTGAPAGGLGTLNDPGAAVLYGGREILQRWESGYRIRAGFWLPDGCSGVDLGFFALAPMSTRAVFNSNGGGGLFRPFFNTAVNAEDAQLIAFTDPALGPVLSGGVGVLTESALYGAEANYRIGWGMGLGGRLDGLVGARYVQLQDRLTIQSASSTLVQAGAAGPGTSFYVTDKFESLNQFLGGQVGFAGEWQIGGMTFGLRGTVALGAVDQRVEVSGLTTGNGEAFPGGLLALPSNSGTFTRRRLSVLPEAQATLGYQVTNNIRVFGGYNLMYWTNVARAGAQVNRNVNATFIPDPTTGVATPVGAAFPRFNHRDENLYIHGWTAGVELRW